MEIAIHKARYKHSKWFYYLKPKRITTINNPVVIYKWLFWAIKLNREEYQKLLYRQRGQTTFIYCPHCDLEQISTKSLIKDTDFVYFKCKNCGTETKWDFDLPCPMLIEMD